MGLEWGKVSDSDQSNAAGVWGSAGENDLIANLFGSSGSLTLTDSTGNCTAVNHGATAGAAYVDGGAAFNGSSAYIDSGCTGSAATLTVETMADTASGTCANCYLVDNTPAALTSGFAFLQSGYGLDALIGTASGYNLCSADTYPSASVGSWQYNAMTYDGVNATQATSYHIYTNGMDVFCTMSHTTGTTMAAPVGNILYGQWDSSGQWYNGTLARIVVCGCVRTQGWLQTSWWNEIFNSQSYYLGSTDTIPGNGIDQLPQPIQFSRVGSTTTTVFPNNLTAGSTLLVTVRSTSATPTLPSGCGATFTLIDSNTAGTAGANPYIYLGTGGSGSCTITTGGTGVVMGHALELPAALGSTVDAHNSGSLAVGGQVILPTLTTTQNGEFLYSYVIGNLGALAFVPPAVSNLSPQCIPMIALSGTAANLGESYAYTGLNGAYSCPFDNQGGISAEQYVQLAIKASSLTILTASLPTTTVNKDYGRYAIQTQGGVGAVTCSVTSGSPPTGITVNSNCVITGTATGTTQTFTVQATDGTHNGTKSLTLTVNSTAGSCSVVTSTSNSAAATGAVSLGTVTSGNLILVGTITVDDHYTQLPTDTLTTPFQYVTTIITRGSYLVSYLTIFQGVAGSSGSDSVTSSCDVVTNCYTVAVQLSNCQTYFDDVSNVIAATLNTSGNATISGPPLLTPEPSSFVWGLVASGNTNGGNDLNFAAGTGYTADASSGHLGVADMLGIHQTGTGGFSPTWTQTFPAGGTPQQVFFSLALRPTTSGAFTGNHRRAWVNQTP